MMFIVVGHGRRLLTSHCILRNLEVAIARTTTTVGFKSSTWIPTNELVKVAGPELQLDWVNQQKYLERCPPVGFHSFFHHIHYYAAAILMIIAGFPSIPIHKWTRTPSLITKHILYVLFRQVQAAINEDLSGINHASCSMAVGEREGNTNCG